MIMPICPINAKNGIFGQHGRNAIRLSIALAVISYGWVLGELRAIGRQLAEDPNLHTYAGLPRAQERVANAAPLITDSRWWRPTPRGSYEPVEFGGTIINDRDITRHNLQTVARAYDRHGCLVAKAVARCNPSRLDRGQGEMPGHVRGSI